jgi:hypothetical protein
LNINFLEPFGPLQTCNRTALPLPLSPIINDLLNLNFLEPSRSLQACNGTALPFKPLPLPLLEKYQWSVSGPSRSTLTAIEPGTH